MAVLSAALLLHNPKTKKLAAVQRLLLPTQPWEMLALQKNKPGFAPYPPAAAGFFVLPSKWTLRSQLLFS